MSIVDNLLKKPKKDKGNQMPHYQTYPKNYKHQIDTLYLPDDNKNKYALVVVDVGTRICDAEPMAGRSGKDTSEALETIYSRDILDKPEKIYVDSGTEFKGAFLKYLDDEGISYRASKPYRHRQTSLAEYKNKIIGKALFRRMLEEEMQTGEVSKQWVDYLPEVITEINGSVNKQLLKKKQKKIGQRFICTKDDCDMLEQGTKVRVALDAPRDFLSGKRHTGNFRETDVRFNPKIQTITHSLIKLDQPPLYIVDDDETVAYTKNQLQVVPISESKPRLSAILPVERKKGKEVYHVEKLIDRKKIDNRIKFKVRWKGFSSKHDTWQKRTELIEDVPELVKEYEKNMK